jgi:hypothetical protein
VFNSTSAENGKIVTGTTNSSGWVYLENVPNATLRFICYTPTNVIIEDTVQGPITTENQQVPITCTQNAVLCQSNYTVLALTGPMILALIGSLILVKRKKKKEKVVQRASIRNRLNMIYSRIFRHTFQPQPREGRRDA